jgi:hypothetical protein
LVVGLTVTHDPVPTYVPPQLPEYHFQAAPVPNDPPCTHSVVLCPGQTGFALGEMPEAATESVFSVTVVLAHAVVLQVPSARTKYVVLAVGHTLIDEPLPRYVPPQLPEYHFQDAPVPSEPPCTVSVEQLPGHTADGFGLMPVGATELVRAVRR